MSAPDRWSVVTTLADPSRRALYEYVRRQDHPVTREEAGDASGMSRGLAAFHLDKLVEAGLLSAHCEAAPDRPRGRGRTPKVYRAVGDGLAITMPERRYELLAEILADAVAGDPADAPAAARHHAYRRGQELGGQSGGQLPGGDLAGVLAGLGFEPLVARGRQTVLRNCPFHRLAARHAALVCGLNHAFLTGLIDGLGITGLHARLRTPSDGCCVDLDPGSPDAAPPGE